MNDNTITQIARGGRYCSYTMLCYARMRIRMPEGEWFTRNDYYEFQDQKIERTKIKNYTSSLTETGFLQRHPNSIMWKITTLGLQAIPKIDRKFTELNPHGNSENEEAKRERQQRLQRQENEILKRIASKAPHFTK